MTARKTVAFTGMDSAEGEKLKGLFNDANRRVGEAWALAPENDADMLIVDVDTLYGHMTWLKVHNSGRTIVALSTREQADADHMLIRPVTAENLAVLLASQAGTSVSAAPPERAPEPEPVRAPEPAARTTGEQPRVPEAAPAPRRTTGEQRSVPDAPAPKRTTGEQRSVPDAPKRTTGEQRSVPAAPAEPVAAAPAAPPAPAVPAPPPEPVHDPKLGDYLQAGALPGPVKLKLGDAAPLVIDPHSRTYLGPTTLKGFVPYAKAVIRKDEWHAITPAEFERLKGELGGAQPFQRLQWLAALHAHDGQIARGFDPNQKYKLLKWPQIEREFPKHFRIATAMMKGPQLLTEIAEGSGATLAEATDFVNASLATGFAEMDAPPPAPDATQAPKGGLLGRLRR